MIVMLARAPEIVTEHVPPRNSRMAGVAALEWTVGLCRLDTDPPAVKLSTWQAGAAAGALAGMAIGANAAIAASAVTVRLSGRPDRSVRILDPSAARFSLSTAAAWERGYGEWSAPLGPDRWPSKD